MRQVSTAHMAAWRSGDHTGPRKPMQRATVQVMQMQTVSSGKNLWAEYLFAQPAVPKELPNLQDIEWDRSVDTDAGTCTLKLYNTKPLPLGTAVYPDDWGNYVYDQPGYYTFNRGAAGNRWGQQPNEWQALLVPDRLIRTYEGYGFDPTVGPDFDPHMYQSGVWLIDDVDLDATGKFIVVTCRDAGRLGIEQIAMPPVVPRTRYPLKYQADVVTPDPPAYSGTWNNALYNQDSGIIYRGANASILGHKPVHAFDTNPATYWLSVGHATATHPNDVEWISGVPFDSEIGGPGTSPVDGVEFRTWGGPYVAYLSFKVGGVWKGIMKIPYDPGGGADNGAGIPYLHKLAAPADSLVVWKLPTGPLADVQEVRITLRQLYNSHQLDTGAGSGGPYRAGIRSFATSRALTLLPQTYTVKGDYADYADIVKELLGMAGFLWPSDSSQAYLTMTDGSRVPVVPPSSDAILGVGRVWADIQMTGTTGVPGSILDIDVWDKKPLMDGITYVRDVVGFNFFVDETGAGVFRIPNIWKVGNWIGDVGSGLARLDGVENLITIDENDTLLNLSVKLSSRSWREHVFIANTTGKIAAVSHGRTGIAGPYDAGIRRVSAWTDQNFRDVKDCQVMADLITLRQLFTYRTDKLSIPGCCAIQIDDQVVILEGTTAEDYVHYVQGIKSKWNIEEGEWTYDLDTHWLGEDPDIFWAFQVADLHEDTQAFLAANGST